LARAEPRLRDHALADPALQREIVQTVTNQTLVEPEERLLVEPIDHGLALGVRFQALPVLRDQLRIRRPGDVLGRIVGCVTAHAMDGSGSFAATPRGVCAACATLPL